MPPPRPPRRPWRPAHERRTSASTDRAPRGGPRGAARRPATRRGPRRRRAARGRRRTVEHGGACAPTPTSTRSSDGSRPCARTRPDGRRCQDGRHGFRLAGGTPAVRRARSAAAPAVATSGVVRVERGAVTERTVVEGRRRRRAAGARAQGAVLTPLARDKARSWGRDREGALMLKATVVGNVWSTKKVEGLPNGAFLEVEVEGGGRGSSPSTCSAAASASGCSSPPGRWPLRTSPTRIRPWMRWSSVPSTSPSTEERERTTWRTRRSA